MSVHLAHGVEAVFKDTATGLEARLKDLQSGWSWTYSMPRAFIKTFLSLLSRMLPGFESLTSEDLGLADEPEGDGQAHDDDDDSGSTTTVSGYSLLQPFDSIEYALERYHRDRRSGMYSRARRDRSASPCATARNRNYGAPGLANPREVHALMRAFKETLAELGPHVVFAAEYDAARARAAKAPRREMPAFYPGAPAVSDTPEATATKIDDDGETATEVDAASSWHGSQVADGEGDADDKSDVGDNLLVPPLPSLNPRTPREDFRSSKDIALWAADTTTALYGREEVSAPQGPTVQDILAEGPALFGEARVNDVKRRMLRAFPSMTPTEVEEPKFYAFRLGD